MIRLPLALVALLGTTALATPPVLLDDQFILPSHCSIYKVADASLCGGSYDILLDKENRLLVGDGQAIRRLNLNPLDAVYESYEIIAEGLGPRGPQGMLLVEDNLYAVGSDGVRLFTGYVTHEQLLPQGRLGQPFRTGGDHDAHGLMLGHDGWIYLICGDGSGVGDRKHITEPNSAAQFERSASVFRFDLSGTRWECVSTGGRNPPNLGMNELGELFSLDSDMEWHVALPWYRPVRLNPWLVGGDNGWQSVGAYPPYYIDNAPGILDVGRGSPNWGLFYEGRSLPRCQGAYLVADYRWKSATDGEYNSSGRVLAFSMSRQAAWWKAEMRELVKPKPGAKDEKGQPISFSVVDLEVSPDGSLLISDHNQGVWRVFSRQPNSTVVPAFGQSSPGPPSGEALQSLALDKRQSIADRIHATRLLSAQFATLSPDWLRALATTDPPELRGYAAWLLGLRRNEGEAEWLGRLLADREAHVRRRAAEAANRHPAESLTPVLLASLDDPERIVRYSAMTALAHRSPESWKAQALASDRHQVLMRALSAAHLRREAADGEWLKSGLRKLLSAKDLSVEHSLDWLRLFGLYRETVESDEALKRDFLAELSKVSDAFAEVRWEKVRLLGEYRSGYETLLAALWEEKDPVTQFHIAQALAKQAKGAVASEHTGRTFSDWLLENQEGWFAEAEGKGHQFPHFWSTVLADAVEHLGEDLRIAKHRLKPASQLAQAMYPVFLKADDDALLRDHFRQAKDWNQRRGVLAHLGQARKPEVALLLTGELKALTEQSQRDELWKALANMPLDGQQIGLIPQGLAEARDSEALARLVSRMTREAKKPEDYPAIARIQGEGEQGPAAVYRSLLLALGRDDKLLLPVDRCLQTITGEKSGLTAKLAATEEGQAAVRNFWAGWYSKRFGKVLADQATLRNDEETLALTRKHLADPGDATRGAAVYTKLGCFACHGGLKDKTTVIFGPDLAGVTARLTAEELANSLVYPSKQVAERYRATTLTTKKGEEISGFVSEDTAEGVSISDGIQARKIPRADIEKIQSQDQSLMPAKLLNGLSGTEIRDLMGFLKALR